MQQEEGHGSALQLLQPVSLCKIPRGRFPARGRPEESRIQRTGSVSARGQCFTTEISGSDKHPPTPAPQPNHGQLQGQAVQTEESPPRLWPPLSDDTWEERVSQDRTSVRVLSSAHHSGSERRDSGPHASPLPLLSPELLHTPGVSGAGAVSSTRTFYLHGDSVLARQHPWFSSLEHMMSGRTGGEKGMETQSSEF